MKSQERVLTHSRSSASDKELEPQRVAGTKSLQKCGVTWRTQASRVHISLLNRSSYKSKKKQPAGSLAEPSPTESLLQGIYQKHRRVISFIIVCVCVYTCMCVYVYIHRVKKIIIGKMSL